MRAFPVSTQRACYLSWTFQKAYGGLFEGRLWYGLQVAALQHGRLLLNEANTRQPVVDEIIDRPFLLVIICSAWCNGFSDGVRIFWKDAREGSFDAIS